MKMKNPTNEEIEQQDLEKRIQIQKLKYSLISEYKFRKNQENLIMFIMDT